VTRDFPKPLVLFTPKAFLRAKEAQSPVAEFTDGVFCEVLDDGTIVVGDRAEWLEELTG
jgi:2-oxoglutarate dehydrogenase E1 component